jgi:hypothetical protein
VVLVNGTLNIEKEREEGCLDIPMVQEGVLEPVFLKVKDSEVVKIFRKCFRIVFVRAATLPEIIED